MCNSYTFSIFLAVALFYFQEDTINYLMLKTFEITAFLPLVTLLTNGDGTSSVVKLHQKITIRLGGT